MGRNNLAVVHCGPALLFYERVHHCYCKLRYTSENRCSKYSTRSFVLFQTGFLVSTSRWLGTCYVYLRLPPNVLSSASVFQVLG